MTFEITSDAFEPGGALPVRFTADGLDVSPPLRWSGVPAAARELALILEDFDSRGPRPFVHWIVYRIPPDVPGLPPGLKHKAGPDLPGEVLFGRNSIDNIGYDGPEPPMGRPHHYHFRLFALDRPVDVEPRPHRDALLKAMHGSVIAEAQLVATYKRPW